MEFSHKPVLLTEAIDALEIKLGGIYVDGTAGGGGHSAEIAARLSAGGRLICIDQDPDVYKRQGRRPPFDLEFYKIWKSYILP